MILADSKGKDTHLWLILFNLDLLTQLFYAKYLPFLVLFGPIERVKNRWVYFIHPLPTLRVVLDDATGKEFETSPLLDTSLI